MMTDAHFSNAGLAHRMPLSGAGFKQGCIVMGAQPDADADMLSRRIMDVTPLTAPQLVGLPIRDRPDRMVAGMALDRHEIGHCYDRFYLPEFMRLNYGDDPERYAVVKHKMEAFAEAFSILAMAREGFADLAPVRARQRLIGLATSGIRLVGAGPDNPFSVEAYAYALHGSIRLAQQAVDAIGPAIRTLSNDRLVDLAREVAENDPLATIDAKNAITEFLRNRFDLASLRQRAAADPAAARRLDFLARLRSEIADAFAAIFGPDISGPGRDFADALRPVPIQISDPMIFAANRQARQERTLRLMDDIRRQAGGNADHPVALVEAVNAIKDRLRTQLDSPSAKRRCRAMDDLSLMPVALRLNFDRVCASQAFDGGIACPLFASSTGPVATGGAGSPAAKPFP